MEKTRQTRKYSQKPSEQTRIALERINRLFEEAAEAFNKDRALSNRYVCLARRISMKYKIRIPSALKRRFCRHCHHYLVPGKNCAIRLKNHAIVCYCQDCKETSYFPYIREQKARRLKKRA